MTPKLWRKKKCFVVREGITDEETCLEWFRYGKYISDLNDGINYFVCYFEILFEICVLLNKQFEKKK